MIGYSYRHAFGRWNLRREGAAAGGGAEIRGVEERAAAWSVIDSLRQESSSLPQSAFRWILADERVATVSSGASNVSELEEVVEAGILEPLAHQ